MNKSKENKKGESVKYTPLVGDQTPSQKLIFKVRDDESYDLTNLKEDLEKPVKGIENAKKEIRKNYRDIKSEILKNESVTGQKLNNLSDNFYRKLNKFEFDNDNAHEKFKKEIKRFKVLSNFLIAATIVAFAVFLYLFFSKPERPATVIWPEYDYTKQYNPFSDKNPNQSITVGDPAYDLGLIDNTVPPTPFPGVDQ